MSTNSPRLLEDKTTALGSCNLMFYLSSCIFNLEGNGVSVWSEAWDNFFFFVCHSAAFVKPYYGTEKQRPDMTTTQLKCKWNEFLGNKAPIKCRTLMTTLIKTIWHILCTTIFFFHFYAQLDASLPIAWKILHFLCHKCDASVFIEATQIFGFLSSAKRAIQPATDLHLLCLDRDATGWFLHYLLCLYFTFW